MWADCVAARSRARRRFWDLGMPPRTGIVRASRWLYVAKRAGRNRIVADEASVARERRVIAVA